MLSAKLGFQDYFYEMTFFLTPTVSVAFLYHLFGFFKKNSVREDKNI